MSKIEEQGGVDFLGVKWFVFGVLAANLEFGRAAESVELGLGPQAGIGRRERVGAQEDVLLVADDVDSAADGDVASFDIFKLDGNELASFAVFFRLQNGPNATVFRILAAL